MPEATEIDVELEGGTWVVRDADPNTRRELARGKRVDFDPDGVAVIATSGGGGARLRAVPTGAGKLEAYVHQSNPGGIRTVQVSTAGGSRYGEGGFQFGL